MLGCTKYYGAFRCLTPTCGHGFQILEHWESGLGSENGVQTLIKKDRFTSETSISQKIKQL